MPQASFRHALGITAISQKHGNILLEFHSSPNIDPVRLTELITAEKGRYLFTAGAKPRPCNIFPIYFQNCFIAGRTNPASAGCQPQYGKQQEAKKSFCVFSHIYSFFLLTADELLEERTISTLQSVIAAKAYAAENGIALTEEQTVRR